MRFYFRESLLNELETLERQSQHASKMTVLFGRRRVGKTALASEFTKDKPSVYLFVAKKSEALLCEGFVLEIQTKLGIPIHGKVETFKAIFTLLLEHAEKHHFTVIVDEFQEFFSINPSVYSDLQSLWDQQKQKTKMHAIFIGSIYSLMHKIFEHQKEPLFGRADRLIKLGPFTIREMQQILAEHGIHSLEQLFEFYVVTGGMPKYLDLLLTNKCKTRNKILDYMLTDSSPFLNEGRNQLIEEFGKEYTIYFSILELIARGKTSSREIESMIQKNVSAYLDKLENDYCVIRKIKPIDAKPNARLVKYQIIDNFLRFWFRFFHRNRDAIEIHNYDYIKTLIKRDFSSYAGRVLEQFFVELLAASKEFNRIGTYWERGYKDEIDIVAINDMKKILVAAEVKTNTEKNSQARLEQRGANLLKHYPDYTIQYLRLSLEDANRYLSD